ncbi:hypothetical protein [Algoriphagus aquimarinus]|uniref:Uncharacterized protein n=1 Tax=Algoriphagus aquimarinus TaxID=237018 RepID=A0A5C7A7S2_9BACT|nr:hypothetical protein [Algoriphagus aquimarinus]TXE01838.1 hypothetical protein ESV85_21960 [Algoriphagus aquimarinus]
MLNWKLMADPYPVLGDIIIIAKDGENSDRSKWLIGQFLQTEDGQQYGVLVDLTKEGAIIKKTDKFKYWCKLLEGGKKIPPDPKEEDFPEYYDFFKKLIASYENKFIVMAKLSKMAGGNFYALDLYFDGVYNRSLSLLDATLILLDSKNFMAAASIVRLHLDNFLRLHAAWIVDKPYDFVSEVMDGKSVRNLKDRNGNKMWDGYLVEDASKKYPWIRDVYDKSCGFIHFSGTHIFSNQKIIDNETRTIGSYIGKRDWDNVTDLNRIEVLAVMIEISDCILEYAYGWAIHKMQAKSESDKKN